ncbi:hypothetical protein ANO11243_016090 [Dothideomycetidae sp. 11243]|nr:hypothetical protein ANO11243_016090 [fungal sp. No.11243]
MASRRKPSGSVTPRKPTSVDAHLSASRRPAHQPPFPGSHNGSASTINSSSRRSSLNDPSFAPGSISPTRDHHGSAERAAKRRKISISEKSHIVQTPTDARQSSVAPPGKGKRKGGRRRSSTLRDAPINRKKPIKRIKSKRDSSASISTRSDIDMRSDPGDDMLDEIVLNTTPKSISSASPPPEDPGVLVDQSTFHASRAVDANRSYNGEGFSGWLSADQPGDGDSRTAKGLTLTISPKGSGPVQNATNKHGAKRARIKGPTVKIAPPVKVKAEQDDSTDRVPQNIEDQKSSTDGRNFAMDATTMQRFKASSSTGPREGQHSSVDPILNNHLSVKDEAGPAKVENEGSKTASDPPTALSVPVASNRNAIPDEDEPVQAPLHNTAGDQIVRNPKYNSDRDAIDDESDAISNESYSQEGSGSAADYDDLGEDAVVADNQTFEHDDKDIPEEDDGQDLDADEEMIDGEDDLGSDQSKPFDDTGSAAASEQDDDDAATGHLGIPKVITTSASPLAASEEENGDIRSPASMAADELAATGPTRPVRRLPGRRRAPHSNPKVEAALRRQLDLKTLYRAVSKQLKPVLAELARRNLSDLKINPEAHLKASEYPIVKADLEDRLRKRLNNIEQSTRYNVTKITTLLEAEQNSQRMRYRQAVRNAQTDFINKLKHDLLLTVRRHEEIEDEHASDNEEGDVISSLYHVNVHGRRTHILDRRHDSRSRRIIETDHLFNELSERHQLLASELPAEAGQPQANPKPFTFLDPIQREAVEHDRKLSVLIEVLTDASNSKVRIPPKQDAAGTTSVALPNDQALSLQLLATASATAPGPIPTVTPSAESDSVTMAARTSAASPALQSKVDASAAGAKPTMASILNSDEVRSQHRPAQHHIEASSYPSPLPTQSSRLLPGFSDRFESVQRSPELRRYESLSSQYQTVPSQHSYYTSIPDAQKYGTQAEQGTTSRESYASLNSMDRQREPGFMNGNAPSPRIQPSNFIASQTPTINYRTLSPGRHARRESYGNTKLAPKGQPAVPSPNKPADAAIQPYSTPYPALDREQGTGYYRPVEQRALPTYADYTDAASRHRSISEASNAFAERGRDYRRYMPEAHRLPPPPGEPSSRERLYDPFRRSTVSSTEDQSRRFSPHLHRTSTTGTSPRMSPQMAVSSPPPDRYGRFSHELPPVRARQPLPPPPELPHFSAPPRLLDGMQTPLPPMPTGLPPPPLPPPPRAPPGGYSLAGPLPYQSTHVQGSPLMQSRPYESGSGYGRQSLPPLSTASPYHGMSKGREYPGPPPTQAGPPHTGYPALPPLQLGQDDRNGRERKSSVSQQDRFKHYSGSR